MNGQRRYDPAKWPRVTMKARRRADFMCMALEQLMRRACEESKAIGYCKFFVVTEWPWGKRPVPHDLPPEREGLKP